MISWPHELIDAIGRRKALLVIGSGISRNSVAADGKHPLTWRGFLEAALARAGASGTSHIKRAITSGDYLTACDWLKRRLGGQWTTFLREEFLTPGYAPSDFHRELLGLDVRLVLTPNFDKIFDTLATAESGGTVVIKTYKDRDVPDLVRTNTPTILKYHGTIDTPGDMIFTRRDYARERVQHASFYRLLDALILTNTCLFVGCGTSDPDVQLLLEQHAFEQTAAQPHYIVLPGPVSNDQIVTLKECYNLEALTYNTPRGDHGALLDSLKKLRELVTHRQAEFATKANW